MKKNILIGVVVLIVIIVVGWLYLWMQTHAYVATVEREIAALEETIETVAERIGQTAVTDAEARTFHFKIREHLNAVNDHPSTVGTTGFTDAHIATIEESIGTLEDIMSRHRDSLAALDNAANVSDSPLPDQYGTATTLTSTTTLDILDAAHDTLKGHLSYAPYCPDGWKDWEQAVLC